MSLYRCSGCDQRKPGKLSQANWAWWRADNQRVAYRQRLCLQCYVERVSVLEVGADGDRLSCPCCHSMSEDDMDPVYLTVYIPSYGPRRLELPTCGPCAVQVRNRAMENAVKLEDRGIESEGRGPQTETPRDEWERYLGHSLD